MTNAKQSNSLWLKFRNTPSAFGLITITLHWLTALATLGLFGSGIWMVELTYYDPLYVVIPSLHKSFGAVLFCVVIFRLAWHLHSPVPTPLHAPHRKVDAWLAKGAHYLMYLLLVLVSLSGYLITTAAEGDLIVFDHLRIPPLFTSFSQQEARAGDVHRWSAYALIGLVLLHTAAAFQHHWLKRDATLVRMLKPGTTHRHDRFDID